MADMFDGLPLPAEMLPFDNLDEAFDDQIAADHPQQQQQMPSSRRAIKILNASSAPLLTCDSVYDGLQKPPATSMFLLQLRASRELRQERQFTLTFGSRSGAHAEFFPAGDAAPRRGILKRHLQLKKTNGKFSCGAQFELITECNPSEPGSIVQPKYVSSITGEKPRAFRVTSDVGLVVLIPYAEPEPEEDQSRMKRRAIAAGEADLLGGECSPPQHPNKSQRPNDDDMIQLEANCCALMDYCYDGKLLDAKKLLAETSVDVARVKREIYPQRLYNCLHTAVEEGHADVVAWLLELGVSPHECDGCSSDPRTPLDLAITHRQAEVVRAFFVHFDTKQLAMPTSLAEAASQLTSEPMTSPPGETLLRLIDLFEEAAKLLGTWGSKSEDDLLVTMRKGSNNIGVFVKNQLLELNPSRLFVKVPHPTKPFKINGYTLDDKNGMIGGIVKWWASGCQVVASCNLLNSERACSLG